MGFLAARFAALPDHLHVRPVTVPREVILGRLEVEADEMWSFVAKKANKQNGCGSLWRSRHGKSLRSTSGIAVTRVRNSCGLICRWFTGSRRRLIRINMPSTPGSFRRRNTKPLRSTPAKLILSDTVAGLLRPG
jgi:hypothetical protein